MSNVYIQNYATYNNHFTGQSLEANIKSNIIGELDPPSNIFGNDSSITRNIYSIKYTRGFFILQIFTLPKQMESTQKNSNGHKKKTTRNRNPKIVFFPCLIYSKTPWKCTFYPKVARKIIHCSLISSYTSY